MIRRKDRYIIEKKFLPIFDQFFLNTFENLVVKCGVFERIYFFSSNEIGLFDYHQLSIQTYMCAPVRFAQVIDPSCWTLTIFHWSMQRCAVANHHTIFITLTRQEQSTFPTCHHPVLIYMQLHSFLISFMLFRLLQIWPIVPGLSRENMKPLQTNYEPIVC